MHALAKSDDPNAEELLFDLLRSDDEGVACEAAKTLGEIGTRDAVGPLQDRARRVGGDREVKLAANRALSRLQARFLGQGGRLSLTTDPLAGELSVTEGGGEVGIADDD